VEFCGENSMGFQGGILHSFVGFEVELVDAMAVDMHFGLASLEWGLWVRWCWD
jgi:hypothetical protein